jgi:hypothetical protein
MSIVSETVAVVQAGKSKLHRINLNNAALETELSLLDQPYASYILHHHHLAATDGKGNEALHGWRGRRGALLDIAALPDFKPLTHQAWWLMQPPVICLC